MTPQPLAAADASSLAKRISELEEQGIDPKTALKKAAKESGLSKSEAYRLVMTKK